MNAFEQLENKYKKEFKKVFKFLNHQMMYSEACVLLDLLDGKKYTYDENEYAYRWQIKFSEVLNISI